MTTGRTDSAITEISLDVLIWESNRGRSSRMGLSVENADSAEQHYSRRRAGNSQTFFYRIASNVCKEGYGAGHVEKEVD
jgi:hypothetical protein